MVAYRGNTKKEGKEMRLFRWLKWIIEGRPFVHYEGYTCGCCGKGWYIPFTIPTYQSSGEYWDTWGLCPVSVCDEDLSKNQKMAIEKLWNNEELYKCSTSIAATRTYGYGELDFNGFWEYSLRKSWINEYKKFVNQRRK